MAWIGLREEKTNKTITGDIYMFDKLKLKPKYDNELEQFEAIPKKKNRILVTICLQNGTALFKYTGHNKKRIRFKQNTYILDKNYAYYNKNRQLTYLFFEGSPYPISHKSFSYKVHPVTTTDDEGNETTELQHRIEGINYDSVETDAMIERHTFDSITKTALNAGNIILIIGIIAIAVLQIIGLFGIYG